MPTRESVAGASIAGQIGLPVGESPLPGARPLRYAAFISFRHIDPDERWAKWLHTQLETYRLPKALLKGRASDRVGRVFRDAEELAACPDLPNGLKAALAESEYLIVTCSPGTAGSHWVEEEVSTFVALGRKDKILALLVRGEPSEAFPPVFKKFGIEPLAPDVRIDNRRSRNDAELRLVATLIGCNYDDLRQREHERRMRQAMALAAVMAVTAAALCVLAISALIQRDMARSRELAANSGHFLTEDPELSVLLATAALGVRPTEEAEDALRDGLEHDLLRHVLAGSTGGLTRVAFSPDGTRLVTASQRGMLQLWDMTKTLPLLTINAHHTPIASVAYSPDGLLLVTASADDPVARVWNAGTGRLVHELTGHTGGITHAEFSHDGHSVVTSGTDMTSRLWSAGSGEQTTLLSGHTDKVNSAAFAIDDRSVFTASEDSQVMKWDVSTGKPLAKYSHEGAVYALTPSPDGSLVATGSRGYIKILDATLLQLRCGQYTNDDDHEVHGLSFSPDGQKLATAGTDSVSEVIVAKFLGPDNTCPAIELAGHIGAVSAVAFGSDAEKVITASTDSTARLWEAQTGRLLSKLIGQQGPLTDVAVSADGEFAATASADGSTRIWQLDATSPRRVFAGDRALVAPVGTRVMTWNDTSAALWDLDEGHEIAKLVGQTQKINDAVFSADGKLLLTVDEAGAARVWDPQNGSLLHEFRVDATSLSHGAVSRDGHRVAVAATSGLVRIWNLQTGKQQAELRGHTAAVNSLMFSHDGRHLLTASDDGTVRIWDSSNGSALLVYRGHAGTVTRATFTPDDTRVVSVGPAKQTDLTRNLGAYQFPVWDARTGKDLRRLGGHRDYLHDVVLSPDGERAVSASDDTTAIVWNVKSGLRISILGGHRDGVRRAVFSPDGEFVATTGGDCALRVWNAHSAHLTLEFGQGVGCFDNPQFSADGSSIIASSNTPFKGHPRTQGVAVLPCDPCVAPDRLLALARSRVTRGLSASEKARYLK
jgi:WD40 repeat protein